MVVDRCCCQSARLPETDNGVPRRHRRECWGGHAVPACCLVADWTPSAYLQQKGAYLQAAEGRETHTDRGRVALASKF
jgi:hypothetical protein